MPNKKVLTHTGFTLYWTLWVILSSNHMHVFAHVYVANQDVPT